jgi:moderate conductance mechanosensitive channel
MRRRSSGCYLAGPVSEALRILFVIVVALVIRALAHRVINKLTERAATATRPVTPTIRAQRASTAPRMDSGTLVIQEDGTARREQRARALGSILRSGVSIVVFGIATLTILGDLGFNLTPLLLSTTVLGVALGFGAQNLVRDYLSGILMLVEDHYGVGDVINVKDATGTVEAMTLLTTRLRDVNGVVWHIRNGTIDSVGNESQGWSRAVIDYPVPYEEDLDRIRALMEEAVGSLFRERGWRKLMLEEPEVWGGAGIVQQGSDHAHRGQDRAHAPVGGSPRVAGPGQGGTGRGGGGPSRPGHHRDHGAARRPGVSAAGRSG